MRMQALGPLDLGLVDSIRNGSADALWGLVSLLPPPNAEPGSTAS